MRKIDWIALFLVIAVAIGGKVLGGGGSVPGNQPPRRPSPELFEPQLWDAETRAWLEQGGQTKHSGMQGTFLNPGEGNCLLNLRLVGVAPVNNALRHVVSAEYQVGTVRSLESR